MLVSRIGRRFRAPIVRMVSPPRSAILSAFQQILSRGFGISQYEVWTRRFAVSSPLLGRTKRSLPISITPTYKTQGFFVTCKPTADCTRSDGEIMKRVRKGEGKAHSTRPIQFGALPYREDKSGVQILLVTSRGTRRWIVPKGWPQAGTPPHRAAAREAFEEAGVVGKVSKKTVGSYWYDKIFESGTAVRCKVRVYPLRVTRQFKRWPEKRQRRTEWHSPGQASRRVREINLSRIIRTFAKQRKVEG